MFTSEKAVLLVIDIQGKLAHLMYKKNELIRNISTLVQAAPLLEVPIIVTEQAPDKIGPTIPEIAKLLEEDLRSPKNSFSCCGDNPFTQRLEALNRRQVIVTGIETHVCVYQTVYDLLKRDYQVQVVADAVSSRSDLNKHLGLERIKSLSASITSTEMIICELLKTCEHSQFKKVVQLIK